MREGSRWHRLGASLALIGLATLLSVECGRGGADVHTPKAQSGAGGTSAAATQAHSAQATFGSASDSASGSTPVRGVFIDALQAVDFVDPQHGWVGGQDGILATVDGGQHWHQQDASQKIVALAFVSPLVGWASTFDRLLGTTDGGQTWNTVAETYNPLVRLQFVDSSVGWGVATDHPDHWPWGGGFLSKTVDGGRTWSSVSLPVPAESVCAMNPTDIWIAGHRNVLHSVDGGVTWSTTLAAPISGQDWAAILRCIGPDVAWVEFYAGGGAMQQDPLIIYRTQDRGATWDAIMSENYFPAYTPAPRNFCCYTGSFTGVTVAVPDAKTAFVTAYCPACGYGTSSILRTADTGASWNASDVPSQAVNFHANALDFVDAGRGWVIGTRVYHTPDAGVVAEEADIFATSDGGATWTQQYSRPLAIAR